MTTPYVSRTEAVEIPEVVAQALISGTVRQSAALSCFTKVPVGTRENKVPVLSADIDAAWVTPYDVGLKTVDAPSWAGTDLIVEELACIVPVPQAVIDDESFSINAAMQPLFVRAMARKIDKACILGGADKPAGWTANSLLEECTAVATNTLTETDDPVEDLLLAAEVPSSQGYIVNRAIVRPGWQFRAASVRARDLVNNPAGASDPFPLLVAGLPLYIDPPAWDATKAISFVLDSSCFLIGMRQDLAITVHTDGVISDSNGVVKMNLMQQDMVAYRAVMRVGYTMGKPPTDSALDADHRSPVAMVAPAPA